MDTFIVGDENIEVVQYFNLLGSIIDEDGGCKREVTRRLALGRVAVIGLQIVWKDRSLSVKTKARLVKSPSLSSSHVWVREMDTGESNEKHRFRPSKCGVGDGCFGYHGLPRGQTHQYWEK